MNTAETILYAMLGITISAGVCVLLVMGSDTYIVATGSFCAGLFLGAAWGRISNNRDRTVS